MTRKVIVLGIGLHTGAAARVVLRACEGPVRLSAFDVEVPIGDLLVASTHRATTVEAGRLRVGTVEHAFAALAGLGVYEGVCIEVEGPEMPLLDGAASAWCDAIKRLAPAPGKPKLRVVRSAVIHVGSSRYDLSPFDSTEVNVRLEFDDPRISPHACWAGDPKDFCARIAPARTFAFAHEADELLKRGLALHVNPASVVLIAPEAIHHAGHPFLPDEPARHKLLDLLGDLYIHGGPPIGRLSAIRPGHAANARAIAQALADGVLVRI